MVDILLDLIKGKIGDGEADIYLDIDDFLKGKTVEQVLVFCSLHGVEVYGKAGRWIMPLFSIRKVD